MKYCQAAPAGELFVGCAAVQPVTLGQPLVFEAQICHGSGNNTYAWRDDTGPMDSNGPMAMRIHTTTGKKGATLTVTDVTNGNSKTVECQSGTDSGGHVMPADIFDPQRPGGTPSVSPALWLPKGPDGNTFPFPASTSLAEVRRAFRAIRAQFALPEWYGKTFRLEPLESANIVRSPKTERQICCRTCLPGEIGCVPDASCVGDGRCVDQPVVVSEPDCDPSRNRDLVCRLSRVANIELEAALTPKNKWSVPFTREVPALIWGAVGLNHNGVWVSPHGVVGEHTIAPIAGMTPLTSTYVPPLQTNYPDSPSGLLTHAGYFGRRKALGHEVNHGIGTDTPHNFTLPPFPSLLTPHDRCVGLHGPWLTQDLADSQPPTATFVSPAADATVSGSVAVRVDASDGSGTDSSGLDALVLLVDEQFWASTTAAIPTASGGRQFLITLDTTKLNFGPHVLAALVHDNEGNVTTLQRTIVVMNQVLPATTCSEAYPSDGSFEACFYDGAWDGVGPRPTGAYLGTLLDHPFPIAAPNAAMIIRHYWGQGQVAFGRSSMITGVWRGKVNFPANPISVPANGYLFSVSASDGFRVYLNEQPVSGLDAWSDNPGFRERIGHASGLTNVKVVWYQRTGPAQLEVSFRATQRDFVPGNNVPTITGPTMPIEVIVGDQATFTLNAHDVNGLSLPIETRVENYGSIEPLGAVLWDRLDGTWLFRWYPSQQQAAREYKFIFTVTSASGDTAVLPVLISVAPTQAPVFEPPFPTREETVLEGQMVVIPVLAADPQGSAITYNAPPPVLPPGAIFVKAGDFNSDGNVNGADLSTLLADLGANVTTASLAIGDLNQNKVIDQADVGRAANIIFNPQDQYIFAWVPNHTQAGEYNVTITARDSSGFASTQTLRIHVVNAPQLPPLGDAIVNPDALITYEVSGTDDLEAPLTHTASNLPDGAVFVARGDVDVSGSINATDLSLITSYINGVLGPSPVETAVADVNQDGQVTYDDVNAMLPFLFGAPVPPERLFAWMPYAEQAGDHPVLFTATNRAGVKAAAVVHITVPDESVAPIIGRVRRDDGVALPFVRMDLSGRSVSQKRLRLRLMTGADGTYTFAHIPAGTYDVTPTQGPYQFLPYKLDNLAWNPLQPVATPDFVGSSTTIVPPRTAGTSRIEGTVFDVGRPVGGVTIKVRGFVPGYGSFHLYILTGPDGHYVAENLPAGSYRVYARASPMHFTPGRIDLTLGQAQQQQANFTRKK